MICKYGFIKGWTVGKNHWTVQSMIDNIHLEICFVLFWTDQQVKAFIV